MQKLPPFTQLFEELIQTSTVSHLDPEFDLTNLALIEKLANWLTSLGFQSQIIPIPNHPKKYNLLASYGKGTGGLLLAGHSDTVPYDASLWNYNPLKLTFANNRWYGLGTTDMKGFFAIVLDLLNNFDLNSLTKPLYILATADEETSMLGAAYFSKTATIKPDYAIIGEPTELKPIRAHKGFVGMQLQIIGKSGHSSLPDNGINAISLMHEAIGYLKDLQNHLKQQYQHPLFPVAYPTLNLGVIKGGDAVNRICAEATLQFEIRPTSNVTITELEGLLQKYLQPLKDKLGENLKLTPVYTGEHIPPYECAATRAIVKAAEDLTGTASGVVNYATEAPFIQQICPTLILGPGSIEQAHMPDEYMANDYVESYNKILSQLIKRFCC